MAGLHEFLRRLVLRGPQNLCGGGPKILWFGTFGLVPGLSPSRATQNAFVSGSTLSCF